MISKTALAQEYGKKEKKKAYSAKSFSFPSYVPKARALVLSPRLSMTSGEGPTNASPACSTLRANTAFSDKNPYLSRRKWKMRKLGFKAGQSKTNTTSITA